MSRFASITVFLVLCAPAFLAHSLWGQSRGAITVARHGPTPGMGQHRPAIGFSIGEGRRQRPFRRGSSFYGYAAPYYTDYDESYEPEPRPTPAIARPTAVPEVKSERLQNEPLPDPVLLELRGNQWVRVANFGASSGTASSIPQSEFHAQAESAPALLVYRDGRTEEVSSYSIIGRTMYTKSDYWATGSWTRTIQIADLDVPATLRQNQQRGVKFELPSGPDEVMIRP